MSVLVEAVTLVVRRPSLDLAYPGGAEAFLQATRRLTNPPRFACAIDPNLVNVSFEHPDYLAAAVELLTSSGLTEVEEAVGAVDFVCVDQSDGPDIPCSWLEWERFTDGVTVAWMAGKEPGALAAPKGWTPAEPATPPAGETPKICDRLLPLAVDDGTEILLDLETGAQIERPHDSEQPMSTDSAPLHGAVVAALADAGWTVYHVAAPAVMVDLRGENALYSCRYFVSESIPAVICYTRAPITIPQAARRKAMEFITRANYGLLIGAFEMSVEDGIIFFRASCAIEDGVLTTQMACTLANVGVWAFDRYFPKLLAMVYGKRTVVDAVREAER